MPAVGDQHKPNGSTTTNPFDETRPRLSEYTAQEIATLQSRLDKQLGPEYISSRPGAAGQKVHYLPAEKVINLANEVFGFNGWSSAIQNIQIDFVDENQNGRVSLGLSVIVRVTLKDGTFHEDVGYGHIENCKGKAAAFEKAKKEGTTDALKRALRTFGNILGNCIYDKEFVAKVTKIKVAPSKWDADNLHRHRGYAPAKKEAIQNEEANKTEGGIKNEETSTINGESNHTPNPETDDDFGIADFDDADFSESHAGHPDEITLPVDDSRSTRTANSTAHRRLEPSVPDLAAIRNEMTTIPKPANSGQCTTPLAASRALPTDPTAESSNSYQVMQPPTAYSPQPHAVQSKARPTDDQQQNSNDIHLTSSTAISPQHFAPQPPYQQSLPSNAPQQIPPVTFYSARAAPHVNTDTNAAVPPNVPKFDPHAESPSIRKTAGVDRNKTVPVKRGLVVATVALAPAVRDSTIPRTNPARDFVNPSTDMHRRIGAPGAPMQSTGAVTGSAYRPPTRWGPDTSVGGGGALQNNSTIRRTPLGDISNNQQSTTGPAEGRDAKRQRLTGPENSTDGHQATGAR